MVLALWLAAALAGTVNEPVVNMYSRPTVDADVVSQAIYGSQVCLSGTASWLGKGANLRQVLRLDGSFTTQGN